MQCLPLYRVDIAAPGWMRRGVSQPKMRQAVWRQAEDEEGRQVVVEVDMKLVKILDVDVDRNRVQTGGVWPVGASRMIDEKSCWLLNEIPAELCEQLFMQQREMGIEQEKEHRWEWDCSDWMPQISEEWTADVRWTGQCWDRPQEDEGFGQGDEERLLGEGWGGLRCDRKWQAKLKQAKGRGKWGILEVFRWRGRRCRHTACHS